MSFWNSLAFSIIQRTSNLISGSSAFSKSTVSIWKFLVHILLKPDLKNFDHYFASLWNKHNLQYFEHTLALPFFGIGMNTNFFQSCGYCWVFQICWHIECGTFIASSLGFEIVQLEFCHLNQLFVVMLPKTHLTSLSRMSASRCMTTSLWLSRSLRPFSFQFFYVCLPLLLNLLCFC